MTIDSLYRKARDLPPSHRPGRKIRAADVSLGFIAACVALVAIISMISMTVYLAWPAGESLIGAYRGQ